MSIDARGIDWSAAGRLIVNGVDCHVEPGSLVGVIVGKLNAELTARTTGETPQNANFGIKNVALAAFLRGASVDYARPALLGSLLDRSPEDLAQEARKASRRIECAP